jgi:hypothetical protein
MDTKHLSLNVSELSGRPAELPCLGGTIRANNGYRASFAKQLLRSESPRHLTYLRAIRFSDTNEFVTCLKGLAWLKSWCRATTQLI